MCFSDLDVVPRPQRLASTKIGSARAVPFTVEVSQLYHTPLLDAVRQTTPGALVLGQGFLWSDLVCYVVGAGAAARVDRYGLLRIVRTRK